MHADGGSVPGTGHADIAELLRRDGGSALAIHATAVMGDEDGMAPIRAALETAQMASGLVPSAVVA